jgi:hypothetical protein
MTRRVNRARHGAVSKGSFDSKPGVERGTLSILRFELARDSLPSFLFRPLYPLC